MELERLTSLVESILFAADRPVSIERFQEVLIEEAPKKESIQEAIQAIQLRYEGAQFGFQLRDAQGGYHFVTKIENAEIVRKFLETKPFRLGRSSLEVLSIIAYRQPITRAEIDQVRGIDSSHLLRTLIERGLVRMAGKAEVPGRPVQYATTPRFLEVLGLKNASDLPPLSELEQLQGDTEDPLKTLERGLDRIISDESTAGPVSYQDKEGLDEIETMIASARKGTGEVHESKAHADVAEANQEAVAALQSQPKPRRNKKSTITFNELQAPDEPQLAAPEELELPDIQEPPPLPPPELMN